MQPEQDKIKTYVLVNNLYINFNRLAYTHQQLYQHLIILNYQTTIDFTNQQALITLTEAIMQKIFMIKYWKCPVQNLCPRVPNRLNYLLWIHQYSQITNIQKILDIGTGSTLVYPLLAKSVFNWKSIATQIQQASYQHATQLIDKNNLKQYIDLRKSEQRKILLGIIAKNVQIDVSICNPPFYEDTKQNEPLGTMLRGQFSMCGGQYELFFQIYRQSFHYPNIKLFTCLIGRKTDYDQIADFLKEEGKLQILSFMKLGQIRQGNNKRFIVAWKCKNI